jgi:hypothetical protein
MIGFRYAFRLSVEIGFGMWYVRLAALSNNFKLLAISGS